MKENRSYEEFSDEFVSAHDAAEILPGTSAQSVLRWARQGKVPAVKMPSGRWLFRRSDIEALLEPRRVTAEEQGPVDEPLPGLGEA